MVIKHNYSFSNNRQIWRLIPTETGKIVIEERDTENKEVFFNCLDISSGEKIFSEFQLEEKFWGVVIEFGNFTLGKAVRRQVDCLDLLRWRRETIRRQHDAGR